MSHAGAVARVCPREALCALLRRRVGVNTPAEECAAFGAFSRHFRPGAPVRKWHYDKGRYTQGRTSHPQSPATRGFFDVRARYTFSRNSKFQVNAEPRNALVSRDSAVLCVCGGDDRNKHRKRKTHSNLAQAGAIIPHGWLA